MSLLRTQSVEKRNGSDSMVDDAQNVLSFCGLAEKAPLSGILVFQSKLSPTNSEFGDVQECLAPELLTSQ